MGCEGRGGVGGRGRGGLTGYPLPTPMVLGSYSEAVSPTSPPPSQALPYLLGASISYLYLYRWYLPVLG